MRGFLPDRNMRPVEVLVVTCNGQNTIKFRSTRAAYQFIEDSIESHTNLHMIHSRVHVSNRLTEDWILVASDAVVPKQFLIRLKPPS